ncbi:hypothetical protein FSP39_021244 [Pinctada imbricata]|uniref:Vacuolar protein sorting-associated protein 13 DH-like domain-containing protein n=1 Tax=Pinctada imbricata TaxID=66713 RepID=A0AA88Y3G5_PINIB|nr:hypothetical protein FSP39_021244 [Pinctada imbricata]
MRQDLKGPSSVPMLDGDFDTVPLCISGHEKKGLVYYVIREDRSPCFVLYNHTPGPVVYGHQDNSLTGNIRIQEETELILDTPTLPPGRNVFYTPSAVSKKFIGGAGSKDYPKLMFGFYPHNTEVKGKESIVWSRAIDVNADMESFLPIPQCTDVKVKVRCVAMVTHITIEPISRAEISAREVRNRIKGKDTDIVIGHTEEVTHVTLTNQDLPNQEEAEKVVVRTMKKKPPPGIQLCLGAYFEHLCFILQDEVTSTEEVSEVVQVCVDNFYFSYLPSLGKSSEDLQQHTCYSVCIGSVQIDNQMFYLQGLYDFPVLFIQQKEQTENFPNISRLNVIEKLAVIKSNSFAHIQLVLESDCLNHSVVKSLEISMHPAAVNIDDNFIYRLLKEVEGLIPVPLNIVRIKHAIVKCLPMSFKNESKTLSSPIRIEQLCIQPVNMLLSVHASLKLFLASDRTPLSFGKLEKKHVCTTAHQLTRVLTMHYASGALFRAGIVVGSLEILGNPTGLVRSIGTGVADLVKMPYSGLTKGPGAFVSGISNGMSSFVRNISSGMITSVTNFASSVSRNMDILSLDDAHQEQQEERRHRQPAGLSSGLKQGLTGFGMSLLGAVAGLADQPLQTVMSRQVSTERPSRLAPATGIVKGVGKGLVGVLTKPIGGAAEFVSQTGQGILQGTGLAGKQPGPRYSPEFRAINTADNSSVKSQMKLLQSIPNATLLMSVNACFIDLLESEVKVQLLLTNELLVVISVEDDAQQQAFSLAELEILNVTGDSQLLSFELKDSHQIEEACPKHEVNKERVEAFIDGALEYAQVSPPDTPPPTDSQSDSSYSPVGRVNLSPKYHFRLEPFTRSLFIELFCMLKNKLAGKGFPVY